MSSQCRCHLSSINLKRFLWLFFICPSFTLIKTRKMFGCFRGHPLCCLDPQALRQCWWKRALPRGSREAGEQQGREGPALVISPCLYGTARLSVIILFCFVFSLEGGSKRREWASYLAILLQTCKVHQCKMPALRYDSIILKVFNDLVQYLWAFQEHSEESHVRSGCIFSFPCNTIATTYLCYYLINTFHAVSYWSS